MIRISFLLVLFVVGRAQAQSTLGSASAVAMFDPDRLVTVYTEALTFIAPRILAPIPVPQLTIWGLEGLIALDPTLVSTLSEGRLSWSRQGQVVLEVATPKVEDPAAWARIAAQVTAALYSASPSIRYAGTQGILQAFFDQMFSHLDLTHAMCHRSKRVRSGPDERVVRASGLRSLNAARSSASAR